jgi:hypothetical protein
MPKKSPGTRYTKEFKAEAVQLARTHPQKSRRQLALMSLGSQTRLSGSGSSKPRSTVASVMVSPLRSVKNSVDFVKRTGFFGKRGRS